MYSELPNFVCVSKLFIAAVSFHEPFLSFNYALETISPSISEDVSTTMFTLSLVGLGADSLRVNKIENAATGHSQVLVLKTYLSLRYGRWL